MADAPPPDAPARILGLRDATCVVVGAIIGVGIFFTPSSVARLTGDGWLCLLAWGLGGVIALTGALVFAELGAREHGSGAQYRVIRDAWGPMPAFCFVVCNATAVQAGAIGIIALVCARHVGAAVGVQEPGAGPMLGLACALIAGITLANILGARWGSRIQNLTVYAKVATLLGVTVLAAAAGEARVGASMPGRAGAPGAAAGVLAALVPCFFAYGGWQHALWISGEVRSPRRNLPLAIIGGVLLVIAAYLAANWAYLRLIGVADVAASRALAADAVGAALPGTGRRIVGAAVSVSAFGVLNAQLLSGPRLIYSLAADGRFFRPFARLGRRVGTPVAAISLLSGLALALLVAASLRLPRGGGLVIAGGDAGLDALLTGAVFIDGVFFSLTGAALFVLRAKDAAGGTRGFRAPPLVPAVFVLGELGIVAGACVAPGGWRPVAVGSAWIVAAALLYVARFRRDARGPRG